MSSAREGPRMSEPEYLAWEAEQAEKHEYVNGEIVAMSGVSAAHARVTMNLAVAFANRLRGGPCQVWGSDLRVRIGETGLYAYPDLTIVCGRPELTADRPPSLTNPRVVIEVLSESTENYDLSAKAAHYRRRATVETLLFVDSRSRRVQRQDRLADGRWVLAEQAEGEITAAGVTVPFEEIYADVELG